MSRFTYLSINFRNQMFSNCSPSPTVDVGIMKLYCPVTCTAEVVWFFETDLLFAEIVFP
jgi:hypothetical protein